MSYSNDIFHHDESAIHYRFYPSINDHTSDTILLLHGFLASGYCFHRMIPDLRKRYHVLTMDFPPFGNSGKSAKTVFSYDYYTRLVISLLDHLHIKRLDIGGHSMGGQIAMRFAYAYPHRINKLFLFAPSSYMLPTDGFSSLIASANFFPAIMRLVFEASSVVKFLHHLVANPEKVTLRMVVAYSIPFMEKEFYPNLAAFIRTRGGDLPNDSLQQIQAETVIFWGDLDPLLPPSIGYRLLAELPNATLHALPDAGHLLPEETPETLVSFMG
ncbi:Pimeloyl-ACP methyl ester carboxylesterase [Terribacillus halophilus]|uniref:Pimeloyl-ACP methyl ester carboxylesterase n=1 Tax=Terribacillus halophilus TaxID=361279 RepID=A0A1G6JN59_9BACI|nr:alpha/beta hydrolase [Terribacillus halophilus]SDC20117.1 Pimeloyl-ACP methyl ester carboxylesterase [Terribacillus halophilus]